MSHPLETSVIKEPADFFDQNEQPEVPKFIVSANRQIADAWTEKLAQLIDSEKMDFLLAASRFVQYLADQNIERYDGSFTETKLRNALPIFSRFLGKVDDEHNIHALASNQREENGSNGGKFGSYLDDQATINELVTAALAFIDHDWIDYKIDTL